MVGDINSITRLVIKYGGSLLYDQGNTLQINRLRQLTDVIIKLYEQDKKISVIVGGGRPTRQLVAQLSDYSLSATQLDHLSILYTRLHASILVAMIQDHIPVRLIQSYEDLLGTQSSKTVNISGGLIPGQSSNAVAALVAECVKADVLVNFFNFDKLHSSDPTHTPEPSTIDQLDYGQLSELISHFEQIPGHYELFDQVALNFIKRSSIPTIFLNGHHPHQIFQLGDKTIGTWVIEKSAKEENDR